MMGVVCAAIFVWASFELVFLGVAMLYLAPRMNRLEVPAKVRRLMHAACSGAGTDGSFLDDGRSFHNIC